MRIGYTLVALALATSPAFAQAPADSTPPVRFTGFVQSSYQGSTLPLDGVIVGSLYGREHADFTLDAFQLGVERPVRTGVRDAGFTVRALYGQSARFIRAAGLDLGPDVDLTQAYVTLGLPAGGGDVQFSMGKMTTMLGLEVIQSTLNPNLSVGNQFIFLENFTDLGIDLNWIASSRFSARVRVLQGWDLVEDNNDAKSVMGMLWFAPDARTTLALCGHAGPEQIGNNHDLRSGAELVASRKFGRASATLQLDAGREQGIDAEWWGAGLWLVLPVREAVDLALRGDWVDDQDGARTSGALGFPVHTGQQLASLTATLNLRLWPDALLRPEVRYDQSSLDAAYAGERSQVIFALSAAFMY